MDINREKVANKQFEAFAKDIDFKVKTTVIRSPQQKASIEIAIKFVDHLKV